MAEWNTMSGTPSSTSVKEHQDQFVDQNRHTKWVVSARYVTYVWFFETDLD